MKNTQFRQRAPHLIKRNKKVKITRVTKNLIQGFYRGLLISDFAFLTVKKDEETSALCFF